MSIGLGSPLWMFDENHREYSAPEPGRLYGRVIWRKHWRRMEVVGETRVSWLVGWPGSSAARRDVAKLPKSAFRYGKCPRGWAFSESHLDELEWVHEHRHEASERVLSCEDPRVLRAVWAALESVE